MSRYRIEESITFDTELYTLTRSDDVDASLSKKEAEVLAVLCIHSGKTVTRQFLFENAWPNGTGSDGHLNRVVLLLRRKFDALGAYNAIKTIPKVGYVLNHAIPIMGEERFNSSLINAQQSLIIEANDAMLEACSAETHENETHEKESILYSKAQPVRLSGICSANALLLNKSKKIPTLFYIFILILLFSTIFMIENIETFNKLRNEDSVAGFREVNSILISNISLSSMSPVDSELMLNAKRILLDWDHSVDGKYYISISAIAVSILHFSENDIAISKKLFINEGYDPLTLLTCALNSEKNITSSSAANTSNGSMGNVHINKGSVVKLFTTNLIAGCDYSSILEKNVMNLSVTTVIDKDANYTVGEGFFYASFKAWSYDGRLVLNLGTSGSIYSKLISGNVYDIWLLKEKTVKTFDMEADLELEPAIKLMRDLVTRDESFLSMKIDEGVYYSDLLGGAIISTK